MFRSQCSNRFPCGRCAPNAFSVGSHSPRPRHTKFSFRPCAAPPATPTSICRCRVLRLSAPTSRAPSRRPTPYSVRHSSYRYASRHEHPPRLCAPDGCPTPQNHDPTPSPQALCALSAPQTNSMRHTPDNARTLWDNRHHTPYKNRQSSLSSLIRDNATKLAIFVHKTKCRPIFRDDTRINRYTTIRF